MVWGKKDSKVLEIYQSLQKILKIKLELKPQIFLLGRIPREHKEKVSPFIKISAEVTRINLAQ